MSGPCTKPGWRLAGCVRRCPSPHPGQECEIEIRRVFEFEDFGDALTPELRAQHERGCGQLQNPVKP